MYTYCITNFYIGINLWRVLISGDINRIKIKINNYLKCLTNKNNSYIIFTMNNLNNKFKEHNFKLTPQRLAIYKIVSGRKDHISSNSIYEKIKKQYPSVTFDTVNRTINSFSKMGIISSIGTFGKKRMYDTNTAEHHHLFCGRCGKIVDLDNRLDKNIMIKNFQIKDFKIYKIQVVVEGLCATCGKAVKFKKGGSYGQHERSSAGVNAKNRG